MAAPAVIEPVIQKFEGDCAIACLSMILALPYSEVSVVANSFVSGANKKGLGTRDIKKIAHKLGHDLQAAGPKGLDLGEETGILLVKPRGEPEHAVVLFQGVLLDPINGWVWDVDAYLGEKKAAVLRLLRV